MSLSPSEKSLLEAGFIQEVMRAVTNTGAERYGDQPGSTEKFLTRVVISELSEKYFDLEMPGFMPSWINYARAYLN